MTRLCEYGCNKDAHHQLKNKKWCCSLRTSSCEAQKERNRQGLLKSYREGRGGYNYDSLPDDVKRRMNWNKENYSNVQFTYNGSGNHKKALILERGYKCEDCGLTEWKGQPIPLELEHCDGDNKNHTKSNLKLFCCNCHALTLTWRGRNINSGKKKVSDEELLTALADCNNIRQALQSVGLAPKGGNYERATKLLNRYAPVAK